MKKVLLPLQIVVFVFHNDYSYVEMTSIRPVLYKKRE